MTQSTSSNPVKAGISSRMAAVGSTVMVLRALFEVEREIVRCLTTFIYRVGDIELKYLLCQHVWESAGHARFIRERGNELGGFGKNEATREEIRRIFEESIRVDEEIEGLAAFYRVIKGELLSSYRKYLNTMHLLADWPSRKLVEEFIQDEERHQAEIQPYTGSVENTDWVQRLQLALDFQGGWFGAMPKEELPNDFNWRWHDLPYRHPDTCNRGEFPTCSSVFGYDPGEFPICRDWLEDP
ncbi:MAG: ferritin-like domain-containing protein, partial [Opitutales bacterium]|nr:ferritin-like domain-containing protein [Opitutales bacterium]